MWLQQQQQSSHYRQAAAAAKLRSSSSSSSSIFEDEQELDSGRILSAFESRVREKVFFFFFATQLQDPPTCKLPGPVRCWGGRFWGVLLFFLSRYRRISRKFIFRVFAVEARCFNNEPRANKRQKKAKRAPAAARQTAELWHSTQPHKVRLRGRRQHQRRRSRPYSSSNDSSSSSSRRRQLEPAFNAIRESSGTGLPVHSVAT